MTLVEGSRAILGGRFALPGTPLEAGGHARLYKAYDLELDRPAAVKVFTPAQPVDPRTLRLAWSNELDAYTRLGSHRNLLTLLAYDAPEGYDQWIAFEWCGEDLQKFILRAPVTWDTFRPISYEILAGLSALHSRGYVHRDLKPKNVLIADGAVKLADFGTIRLREVTSLGMTMNQLGTKPYAPPESGTLNPVPAYDVYSFAVMVLACLSGDFDMVDSGPEQVLGRVEVPEDVRSLLARCLADDPDDRPGSASVLLAELQQIEKQARPSEQVTEVGLEVTPAALRSFSEAMSAEASELADVVKELGPRVRVMLDAREAAGDDILLLGRTVVAVAAVHSVRPGFLVVKHVWKPRVSQMERLRRQSLSRVLRWSPILMRPQEAGAYIDDLLRAVRERHAEVLDSRASRSEVHDRWERVLNAKFALARDRGKDIKYGSFRAEGARIFLSVGADEPEPVLGELRVIRTTSNRYVRGEVESLEDGEIGLYVSEGNVAEIPRRGTLSVDSDRTRSKLVREQSALRRVFEGGAVRSDLKDILNKPSLNPVPVPAEIDTFFQPNLDEAKQSALRSILGATAMSVVQGPPGTGKTTLIAEIIAQELARKPDSRILLASQTHIALDHALSKVMVVSPRASVLRIGTPDQLAQTAEAWTLPAQLAAWKAETQVASSEYLRRHLSATNSTDVRTRELATRFRVVLDRRERTGAALESRRIELEDVVARRDALRDEVDRLLDAVAELESHASRSTSDVLTSSVRRLVDRVVDVGAELAAADDAIRSLDDLSVEVAELASLATELSAEADQIATELRAIPALRDVLSEESLLAETDKLLSDDDRRAQAFQTLADEWIERFRATPEFRLALLFRARIVASTCVALTGSQGADRVAFDLCIVDESSKANPTELMVPLASSQRWVLVGDEKQLPPFIEPELHDKDVQERFDLLRSEIEERLFAELAGSLPQQSVSTLTRQHRMHPAIGDLVSQIFYDGRLVSSPRSESALMAKALGSNLLWRNGRKGASERRVGLSYDNRDEAREISEILKLLDSAAASLSLTGVKVAVITGYSAQVRTLQEVIGNSRSSLKRLHLRIATIDSFQGQESDICIVSMTRDNRQGEVGFLASPERLNVAVSRARDGLVIVGNYDLALRARRKAPALAAIAARVIPERRGRR